MWVMWGMDAWRWMRSALVVLLVWPSSALSVRTPTGRTITDPIHQAISLHPLSVLCVDTPEFQRLRSISQLGSCKWVFPSAVHDRFQHSLGVAHLARTWTEHFQRTQPELSISDADVLCVTLAGLLHDLGHGPMSHFWEHLFDDDEAAATGKASHEDLSCRMIDQLFTSRIDPTPWLDPVHDVEFIKALVKGGPPSGMDSPSAALRVGTPGRLGSDKAFLYEIVANGRSGLDVDKLDYFLRDSHFAGVVKVSFDGKRLQNQARVALADGQLQVCWPVKCQHELLHVFQTRFSLHVELYQHRVSGAVDLMLADALHLADASPSLRVLGRHGKPLRLSECGSAADERLEGYLQLTDGVLDLVRFEAKRVEAAAEAATEAAAEAAAVAAAEADSLIAAHAILRELDERELYRFVGSVVLPRAEASRWASKQSVQAALSEIAELAPRYGRDRELRATHLRADVRHVHYGRRGRNPLDGLRFFDNKMRHLAVDELRAGAPAEAEKNADELGGAGGEHASASSAAPAVDGATAAASAAAAAAEAPPLLRARRQLPASLVMLPTEFEERSLRLFVTHEEAVGDARRAFGSWCERQGWCNDECELEAAETCVVADT